METDESVFKTVEIGDAVIYVDPVGVEHKALVTAIWGTSTVTSQPSINCVYVSEDENAKDQYGRQLAERRTSLVYRHNQAAHGMFWKYLDDE